MLCFPTLTFHFLSLSVSLSLCLSIFYHRRWRALGDGRSSAAGVLNPAIPLRCGLCKQIFQDQEKIERSKVSSKELRGLCPLPPALKIVTSPWSSLFTSFSTSFSILLFSLFPSFSYSLSASIFTLFLLFEAFSPKTSLLPFSSPLWCFSYIFTLPGGPRSSKK